MTLGAHRGAVQQSRRTLNRKGRTCRRLASRRKKTPDTPGCPPATRARPRSDSRTDAAQQADEFRLQRRERRLRHRAPWMNHDVPSRWNLRPIAPQDFPDAAANPIPLHCATQGFLDADAEPADGSRPADVIHSRPGFDVACRRLSPGRLALNRLLRAEENCKLRARAALASAIYSFEISASQQAHSTRKTLPRAIRISR